MPDATIRFCLSLSLTFFSSTEKCRFFCCCCAAYSNVEPTYVPYGCVCVCSTMYVCMQHLNMCTHPACVFKYETHTHKKGGPIISHKIIHEMRYARRRRRRRWAQELQTEIIKGALLLAAAKNYKSVLPPSFTFFLWLAVLC